MPNRATTIHSFLDIVNGTLILVCSSVATSLDITLNIGQKGKENIIRMHIATVGGSYGSLTVPYITIPWSRWTSSRGSILIGRACGAFLREISTRRATS